MNEEACYVFVTSREPPTKKRRVEGKGLSSSHDVRKRIYRDLWQKQQTKIDGVLDEAYSGILSDIRSFISEPSADKNKLKAGFVITGPSGLISRGLFDRLSSHGSVGDSSVLIQLAATDCPNLKTCLKTLIRRGTSADDVPDQDENSGIHSSSGPRLLNFDLELLRIWCQTRHIDNVIVAFNDSEAYDSALLSEVLLLLHSWADRIPFVLLFGIATSTDLFQDRISRSAARCVQGQTFYAAPSSNVLEQVFEHVNSVERRHLRIGPAVSSLLLQRQQDHVQGIAAFTSAIKYGYMCHFFSNPLSVLLSEGLRFDDLSREHLMALRNLPSFRRHVEALVEAGDSERAEHARALLENDKTLFDEAIKWIASSQEQTTWSLGVIRVIQAINVHISLKNAPSYSSLYLKLLSGDSSFAVTLRDMLLSMKKISSDVLALILPSIEHVMMTMPPGNASICADEFTDLQEQLEALLEKGFTDSTPLRSQHDFRPQTLRTTVVARKVELNKQKSSLSSKDAAYSQILSRAVSLLESYFEETVRSMSSMVLYEIIFYDLKFPHRDVFNPKPASANERALSVPHDYLACSCCGGVKGELAATQPATALLFQLYLESGALINVADLWSAFQATLGEQHGDEQANMALFLRSLAELRYLGLIKQSRKKTDHLAKLAWMGL